MLLYFIKIALISKKVYTLDWFPLLIICYPSNVVILTVLFLKVINSPGALSLSQKMIIKASLFSHMYAGNGKLTGTSFLFFCIIYLFGCTRFVVHRLSLAVAPGFSCPRGILVL